MSGKLSEVPTGLPIPSSDNSNEKVPLLEGNWGRKKLLEKIPPGVARLLVGFSLIASGCQALPSLSNPESTPTPPGISEPFSPPSPEPSLTEALTTPQPTPTVEGPTIVGETLAIGGIQLELVTTPGDQLAQQIGARERGWAVVTDENGNSSFFTGYAGPTGKEVQTVVLAQGPQGFEWDGKKMIWRQDNQQVVIPDILLPGGWNEETQMPGPAHEADKVFSFVNKDGNFQVGVIYGPEKMAGIPDKSNLIILPDGSGLFVSGPKNYQLEEGQEVRRDEEGNLRLINLDGSYLLMRTSWTNVTSPDQLYQAGVFAGPIEAMPEIPYPPETFINELGIKNPEQIAFSVIGEKPVMTQNVVDDKGNEQEIIVAQTTTNKEGQFKGWQTTVPLAAETGLVVPDPRATNPELFDLTNPDTPIPQFVNAMQMAGIEVTGEQVSAGITFTSTKADGTLLVDQNGKPFVVATYNLDPDPNKKGEILEGPVPLFIAEQDEKGEWRWKKIDITDIFKLQGKEVQITVESGWGNSQLRRAVEDGWRYFRGPWVITNLGEETTYHPTDPNKLNEEKLRFAGQFISRAPVNGRIIAGHLMWTYPGPDPDNPILPSYIMNASAEELVKYTTQHAIQVVEYLAQRYPARKFDFVVAAELTSGNLFRTKNVPLNLNDPDNSFVVNAYKEVNSILQKYNRVRGPQGDRLAYSDFITGLNDPHIEGIKKILRTLKKEGLIDVFYLQLRYGPNIDPNRPPTEEQLSNFIGALTNETGVPVILSEVGVSGTSPEGALNIYTSVTKACKENSQCLGIMFDKVVPEGGDEIELFEPSGGSAMPNEIYYRLLQVWIGIKS